MNRMRRKDGFTGERSIVLPRLVVDMIKNDPLTSLLHITDMGYYPKAYHHYRVRSEPISQYVLIYCVEGEGWYEVDGTRYDVGHDQYFILPPGIPHVYAASEKSPWTIYWIHFGGDMAPYYAEKAVGQQSVSPGAASRIDNRILETTGMKLNQISFKLGISDPFYFSRMFSKIMGMSPKAYRALPKN